MRRLLLPLLLLPLLLAAPGLLAPGLRADPEPPVLVVAEEPLAELASAPLGLAVSADGLHVAWLARGEGGVEVWRDGTKVLVNPDLVTQSLRLSPDGATPAVVERRGGTSRVFVGATPGAPYAEIALDSLHFSADGRIAYAARKDGAWHAVFGTAEQPPFPEVHPKSLRLSAGGHAYAVMGHGGARPGYAVVHGEAVIPAHEGLGAESLCLSADGTQVAFARRREGRWEVVFGAQVHPAYDRVGLDSLRLSPDGKRLAYWAGTGPKPCWVVDGKAHGPFDLVGQDAVVFSPDSRRVAYAAQVEGRWRVFLDHVPYEREFEAVGTGTLRFSPDGAYLCFAAQVEGRWTIVHDGVPGLGHDAVAKEGAVFSADGRHLAYAARNEGRWQVFRGGEPGPAVEQVGSVPVLSPDGALVAYTALREGASALGVNDAFAPMMLMPDSRPVFTGPRTLGILGARATDAGAALVRFTVTVKGR